MLRVIAGIAVRSAVFTVLAAAPVATALAAADAMPLTTQDPASAQPVLPKPMPDLTVPTGAGGKTAPTPEKKHGDRSSKRHARAARHHTRTREATTELQRPALASVELTERLPYPPQPPHVTVPVPGYPLDDLVTAITAPPPPIVCRPTARDPFQPRFDVVDARAVLCTSDNP